MWFWGDRHSDFKLERSEPHPLFHYKPCWWSGRILHSTQITNLLLWVSGICQWGRTAIPHPAARAARLCSASPASHSGWRIHPLGCWRWSTVLWGCKLLNNSTTHYTHTKEPHFCTCRILMVVQPECPDHWQGTKTTLAPSLPVLPVVNMWHQSSKWKIYFWEPATRYEHVAFLFVCFKHWHCTMGIFCEEGKGNINKHIYLLTEKYSERIPFFVSLNRFYWFNLSSSQ